MRILKLLLLRIFGLQKDIENLSHIIENKNLEIKKLESDINKIYRILAINTLEDIPSNVDDAIYLLKKYSVRNSIPKVVIEKHYIGDNGNLREVVGEFLSLADNYLHICEYCGHSEDIDFDKLEELRKAYDNA